ncbi:MAG: sugar nucleotide-binding protein [Candidatus Eisenbacteria bacterium]
MHPIPPCILVTGGTGLLGRALLARAAPGARLVATWHRTPPPAEPAGVAWEQVDLRAPDALAALVRRRAPDVILHTAVSALPHDLDEVIVAGSRAAAEAAGAVGAAFVQVSSDMVFDGASGPFAEDAPLSPITDYGRAKAKAELAVRACLPQAWIARCSLLYSVDPPDRSLAAWLDGLTRGDAYPLFTDEIRCPAHVDDVADALLALAARIAPGAEGRERVPKTLHLVGPRALSRHAFGKVVLGALKQDPALATAALSASSAHLRPRELVLETRGTPGWLTGFLRAPEAALSAKR